MTKRIFHFTSDAEAAWSRIWPTRGAVSESEALRQFIHALDESLRSKLDGPGIELFDRGELTRSEFSKACARYQRRKKAIAEASAAS
jgi:hypothetical protein